MGIETMLTLLVAAGILGLALTLRLLFAGAVRLVEVFTGEGTLSPHKGRHSIDAARAGALFVVASIYSGMRALGRTVRPWVKRADAAFIDWVRGEDLPHSAV